MSSLIHLIYASVAIKKFQDSDLIKLLTSARQKNTVLNVTGMLLYCDNNFFQVIEGEERVIHELFKTIEVDDRHKNVTKILEEPIPLRSFAKWTMGFSNATKEQLSEIEGMNDFFNDEKYLVNVQAGRAKKLLEAFSEGRWRLHEDTKL